MSLFGSVFSAVFGDVFAVDGVAPAPTGYLVLFAGGYLVLGVDLS